MREAAAGQVLSDRDAEDVAPPRGQRQRDRDPDGRPRSARPRDELGRPLTATGRPRSAAGPSAPDVINSGAAPEPSPDQALAQAQRLLDARRPFHAHEVLEDVWKVAPETERDLWRGLAQLAVGLTHQMRGNRPGAIALLRRGSARIAVYADDPPYGVDVSGLVRWAAALEAELADRVGPRESTDGAAAPPAAAVPIPRLRLADAQRATSMPLD